MIRASATCPQTSSDFTPSAAAEHGDRGAAVRQGRIRPFPRSGSIPCKNNKAPSASGGRGNRHLRSDVPARETDRAPRQAAVRRLRGSGRFPVVSCWEGTRNSRSLMIPSRHCAVQKRLAAEPRGRCRVLSAGPWGPASCGICGPRVRGCPPRVPEKPAAPARASFPPGHRGGPHPLH